MQLTGRVALEDIEVGGVLIRKGDARAVPARRRQSRPAVYPDPDRLDITRQNVRPMSFGGGIHYCLGAQLARIEAEIAIAVAARTLSRYLRSMSPEPAMASDTFVLRGLKDAAGELVSAGRFGIAGSTPLSAFRGTLLPARRSRSRVRDDITGRGHPCADFNSRRARSTTGSSTILPPSVKAPMPRAVLSSAAAMMASAVAISPGVGLNASLRTGTTEGCTQVAPWKPWRRASCARERISAVSAKSATVPKSPNDSFPAAMAAMWIISFGVRGFRRRARR